MLLRAITTKKTQNKRTRGYFLVTGTDSLQRPEIIKNTLAGRPEIATIGIQRSLPDRKTVSCDAF